MVCIIMLLMMSQPKKGKVKHCSRRARAADFHHLWVTLAEELHKTRRQNQLYGGNQD